MPRSPASIPDTPAAPFSGAPQRAPSAPAPAAPHTWDTALETYYVELCEYVLRFVGSAEAAQDLVQDVFLHLWNTRGPRDAERLTRPYLYTSARNAALKYLRHRRVVEAWIERASREEMPTADSPSDLYLRRELEETVARAISELPPRCREIFLLRRRDQLSYQEIAAQAGVSLGTVKCHMWRAMVLLREKLAPYLALISPVIADTMLGL
jgi:RNA polymerase sigma-70 factor (ECF subfamily)